MYSRHNPCRYGNTYHQSQNVYTQRIAHACKLLEDDTVKALLEPGGGLVPADTVGRTNTGNTVLATGHTSTRAGHADVKVHTKDTNTRVVLDTHVNVFGDTETKVARLGKVALLKLVLLHLETTLKNFLSLRTTDCNVASNLFVTADTETTERVASLARHGRLTRQLFQHLGGTRETVTRLTHRDVDDELVNFQFLCVLVTFRRRKRMTRVHIARDKS